MCLIRSVSQARTLAADYHTHVSENDVSLLHPLTHPLTHALLHRHTRRRLPHTCVGIRRALEFLLHPRSPFSRRKRSPPAGVASFLYFFQLKIYIYKEDATPGRCGVFFLCIFLVKCLACFFVVRCRIRCLIRWRMRERMRVRSRMPKRPQYY